MTAPVPSVCLVILDGWGLAPDGPGNAVSLADTPVFDELWNAHPHTRLTACGRAVGLPDGQMGNSEVGHLNLGAGTVVRQDLTRIDDAVVDGELAENPALRDACAAARESGRLHLLGLVSDGGVHASMEHLRALIELAADHGVPDVVLHAFTDGRDTLPRSGAGYLATVEGWLAEHGGRVATVSGRYYAMDRDRRWPRVKLAYDAIVHGHPAGLGADPDDFPGADGAVRGAGMATGDAVPAVPGDGSAEPSATVATTPQAVSAVDAVRAAYERGETDEFVRPTLVGDEGRIRDGDAVVFFNFRPDRARELTRALAEPDFAEFDRGAAPRVRYTTLTEYQEEWGYPVAFPPERPAATLASVLAERGVRQIHVAETEKYPHVTYFFNGGEEHPYDGEERCLVDSPRDVPTYDEKPEMSAEAAASALVERWSEGGYGFGIVNFANPDMVGHTGVIPAAVAAIETVDAQLGRVVAAVHAAGGACIVTADHGNADNMLEPDGSPNTAHSLNPVPLIVTADVPALRDGGLHADVAPTVLDLLRIEQPAEMTGRTLIG
jgi:2,3-bisphosphoglycerate-independent phosphoglycerate mutase